MRLRTISTSAAALLLAAHTASAQAPTAAPFAMRVAQGSTITSLTDGSNIAFVADAIGRPSDAVLSVTYRGNGSAVITALDVTGSTDFIISGLPDFTQAFTPNQTFTLNIRYQPTASARVTGSIRFSYTESPPIPPGGATKSGIFGVTMSGVAPEFFFTVVPQPNGNATQLNPGDTLAFPATNVNEVSSAIVIVANRGSGPGAVNLVTLTGSTSFALAGVAALPVAVDASRDTRFTIRYAPTAIESNVTGAVRIEFIDKAVTFSLTASSQGPVFAYDVITETTVSAVLPGQAVGVPDTLVGDKSSVTIRVRNTGNVDGRLAAINVLGAGFTLSELPFLPHLLTAGSSITFTLNFAPTAPGRVSGRLRVGADLFDVTANGLGATLVYSYIAGNITTTVANLGSVIFPPVPAGQTSTVRFVVQNNGSAAGSVNSISVTTTGTIYTLTGLPNLPATVDAGGTLAFTVSFTPTTVGNVTGTLKVDSLSFTLSGAGNTPAALPDYRFTGATGAQEPGQQVGVGLSLAAAYPLALTGVLTLAFNSDVFANDPAVQFATGGRTIAFTIPAGSRDALFPNNQTSIRLQTGTVSGTLTLTPSFQTQDGGIVLTPTNPPALNMTVGLSAPRLLALQVSGKTAAGFSLLVTGFATGRSITQIDVQFTPVAGENVATTKLSLSVEPSFIAWYQSPASQQFGSQFTATIPFTLAGDVKNVTNVVDTIQSASVTLTNRQGTSASRSVDLR
ncbi:MAG: choice-of-anchor D domain-containing protein [Candidatus Solibacter usitatus]|nr:choice-of-anchor D domain-containing protein [Candidatus Solibacter usitatus]